MAPVTTDFATIAAAALAAIGLIALALGLFRPRRVGMEPHCRKCAYDLRGTAIEPGARCPECGAALELPCAVVIGAPRRRRLLIALGCVGFVVGGAGLAFTLVPGLRKANWYPKLPAAVLLRGITYGDPGGFGRGAARELEGRLSGDTLSKAYYADLAGRCTERLRTPTGNAAFEQALLNILGALLEKDALSDEQRDEFLNKMVTVDLSAPTKSPIGSPLILRFVHHWRGPKTGLVGEVVVDGISGFPPEEDGVWGSFVVFPHSTKSQITWVTKHVDVDQTVRVKLRTSIYAGSYSAKGACLHSRTEERPIELKVVPAGDTPATSSLSIPEATIRELLRFEVCRQRVYGDLGGYALRATFDPIGPPPVSLAFHVSLETHGRRRALGDICFAAGRSNTSYSVELDGLSKADFTELGGKVTLVLTPSREVGLRELDTEDIWPGELRFEDVPLKPGGCNGTLKEDDADDSP